jgi:hypothetical protein
LFVQHQVRFGQRLSFFWDAIVDIRESLRNLSGDRLLSAPSLFSPRSQDIGGTPAEAPAPSAPVPPPASVTPASDTDQPAAPPPLTAAAEVTTDQVVARSFSEQLQASRQRVLLAKVSKPHAAVEPRT